MPEYLNENGYSYEKSEEVRKQRQKLIYDDTQRKYIIVDKQLKQKFKEQRERWEAFKRKQKDGDHNAKFNKK